MVTHHDEGVALGIVAVKIELTNQIKLAAPGKATIAIVPVSGGSVRYLTTFDKPHLNASWVKK